ncbi:Phage lysozyme [compost metagenome]
MQENEDISAALAHCNQPRKDILTSMGFQMGVSGLAGFKNMLKAIVAEDWNEAVEQMLDSTWAKQTPNRAQRHAAVMQSGKWRPTYKFSV